MRSPMPSTDVDEASVLEREITIAARPETVFPYFIDPGKIVRWMGTTAELDPRPGGLFRIDYNGQDIVRGEYLEIDPPHRVVFTWGWEAAGDPTPPGASTVEVTLTSVDGGTRVNLRHSGLTPETVVGHGEGWDQFLPVLATTAAEAEAA
jgi:uncharacterized protein YndB with AHSA1/START domain